MARGCSATDPAGFSLVEVMLAVVVFALMVTAMIGAALYGLRSVAVAGDRARAVRFAEEGLEAARNLRDSAFSNLSVGMHGVATSSNQWVFSGTSDQIEIFTRQVEVGSVSSEVRDVTSTVTWPQNLQGTGVIRLVTRMTNWMKVVSAWGQQIASLNFSGTQDGLKVQTQGNYAYVVRDDGTPDFLVIDVSTPSTPTLVGSLALADLPTNIFVSGTLAYVSSRNNSQELQIIDITTPTAPSVVGTFNAVGNEDALGVYVVGTTVYLVRVSGSSDELIVVNATVPAAPVLSGSLNLGATGYEVYVAGTSAYIASGSNSQELQVVNVSNPLLMSIIGSSNLNGNTDAITVAGFGNTVFLGRSTEITIFNVTTPSSPSTISVYGTAGTTNDIALNFGSAQTQVFYVTANSSKEFEVMNITDIANPVSDGFLNLTGFSGIAYDIARDRAYVVGEDNASELLVLAPL